MEEIPSFLLSRIREGRVILFLGAGASFGSLNQRNETPPLGAGLASLLSKKLGEPSETNDDLSTIAAVAKDLLGDQEYYRFLQSLYQHCEPSDAYIALARYPWPRIYTVNIDDALENAYRKTGKRCIVKTHKSALLSVSDMKEEVQVIKLNGTVDRLEDGMIFTPEEYRNAQVKYSNWYEEVARDYANYTFLFIGTQLNEPIFWHNVTRMTERSGLTPGQSYILCPSFSRFKKLHLEKSKIVPIEGTLEDLIQVLSRELGPAISVQEAFKNNNPALQNLLDDSELLDILSGNNSKDEIYSITVVHKGTLDRVMAKEASSLRRFYYGNEPTWRDILDGVPAQLEVQKSLSAKISTHRRVAVTGPAGCGKTTLLMMEALRYSESNSDVLTLYIDAREGLPVDALDAIIRRKAPRVALFINDVSHRSRDLGQILDEYDADSGPIVVICDRSNVYRRTNAASKLVGFSSMAISRISKNDVQPILDKLQEFGSWAILGKLGEDSRRATLWSKSEKQLLVGLREATMGYGYDKIMRSEYESIQDSSGRMLASVVATVAMNRIPISRKTLYDAHRKIYGEVTEEAMSSVDGIVTFRGDRVYFRHPIIADYVVSGVIARTTTLKNVEVILSSLARFESPLALKAPRIEANVGAQLLNHEFLWRLFKDHRQGVLSVFSKLESPFGNDGLFWLHYALFEEKCGLGYLDSARNHIRTALAIWPSSRDIVHAYANIHFSAALNADNAEAALVMMEESTAMMEEQCKASVNEPYALVGLCKGRMKVTARWAPERVSVEFKALKRRLKEAQGRYPENHEIGKTLRNLAFYGVEPAPKRKKRSHRSGDARRSDGRGRRSGGRRRRSRKPKTE